MTVGEDRPPHDVNVVVYSSPLVRVGRWRCPAEHPYFYDSGPAPEAFFVFPREAVWIQHEGGEPFIADANTVTYYNQGQCYHRGRLSARGDRCEWFGVAPEALAEVLAEHEPAAIDRIEQPFPFTHGPSAAPTYLRQRLVFEHLSREPLPDRLFVEETILSALSDVTRLAYDCRMPHAMARPGRETDIVEGARQLIVHRFQENLSLSAIAHEMHASVFHLCRIFRARTGFPLHVYRNQLRLRAALDRLGEGDTDLIDVALDLGFSSHSHFTDTFRRSFGETPSAVRTRLRA